MPATPCPSCGKPSHAKVMCHACRRERNAARTCGWCGDRIKHGAKRFCSVACAGKADSARRLALRGPAATVKSRRVERDARTAGLGAKARLRLLATWRRQGRTCAYCPAPATTVDHVIPLVRGGTNYEGNLVPACRSCNSRKSDRLVIEFRLGRRAAYTSMPTRVKDERVAKVKPEKPSSPCLVCHAPCVYQTCSRDCMVEWNARQNRERYRARAGLPPTWNVPTRPRKRSNAA